MMTPVPTPYDIADIPRFAYAPGLLEWLLLLAGAALALRFLTRPPRAPTVGRAGAPIAETIAALRRLFSLNAGTGVEKELLFRISTLVKRYLETLFGSEISGMTTPELERFARRISDNRLARVVGHLGELEHRKFAPSSEGLLDPAFGEHLIQALSDLDAHAAARDSAEPERRA